MPRRIAYLIGNGYFPDEPKLTPLPGPANDVGLLKSVLENRELGNFEPVIPLVDKPHNMVGKSILETLKDADRDDLILIYFAGHGEPDSQQHLCLCTRDTQLKTIEATSLTLPALRRFTDASPSRQLVLIFDCCFSGSAVKSYRARNAMEKQIAALAREGLYCLTSCADDEVSAEESPEPGAAVHGRFTHALVEALRSGEADLDHDGEITIGEVGAYLGSRLRGQSPRYTAVDTSGLSPVIAWNRTRLQKRLEAAAKDRLTHWFAVEEIPRDVYIAARNLLDETRVDVDPLTAKQKNKVVELASSQECSARAFWDAWRKMSGMQWTGDPNTDRRKADRRLGDRRSTGHPAQDRTERGPEGSTHGEPSPEPES